MTAATRLTPLPPGLQDDPAARRAVSVRNGAAVGLALGAGVWLPELTAALSLPLARHYLATALLGIVLLAALGAAAGRLSGGRAGVALTVVVWLVTALLANLTVGYMPYTGNTVVGWLATPQLAGRTLFPPDPAVASALLVSGFFMVLLLGALALLQDVRVRAIVDELGPRRRLSARGRLMLLLPLPLVFALGVAVNAIHLAQLRGALRQVAFVIDGGRDYAGDLFWHSQATGVNYVAVESVRARMVGDYRLSVVQVGTGIALAYVAAEFDDGYWSVCRVASSGRSADLDRVSDCWDGERPFVTGWQSAITGAPLPAVCRNCAVVIDPAWQAWLAQRRAQLGSAPRITRVAHGGALTVMRADSAESQSGIVCTFSGAAPVVLTDCRDAAPR